MLIKIGLISDTHSPAMGREPPPEVDRAFAGVGLILHAGDIYTSECLDALERIAPVLAVEVPPTPADGDPRIEYRRLIELDGYRVELVHDLNIRGIDESTPGLVAAKYPTAGSLAGALEAFFGGPVDVAVFGHTHFAMVETDQGVLLVNPGSPTFGFAKKGEGGPFVSDGALSADGGSLPTNTSGGQLSEGYIHGHNLILEAVRQVRGDSSNQIEDAELSMCTSGNGVPTSAIVLSRR